MEYVEKTFECAHKQKPPQDTSGFEKLGKMPLFLVKWLLKKNIGKMREMMGGDSKDITSRKITTTEKRIPGYKSDIKIRIYSPEEVKTRPVMMFYHGGGWIGGSLGAVEEYCKGVCDQGDCVVISVEYHLAPEHPYPEGLEDSYAAVKWAVQNQQDLGIDSNKITVSGDSAGGNFAAILTFMAKERQEFTIAKQILIYPGTNLAEEEGSPMSKEMTKVMRALNGLYLKDNSLLQDLHISPVYAPNFADQPDALLTVGDQDFLYDSVKKYTDLLTNAGNKAKLIIYKETNHAFIDNTGNCMEADDFVSEAAEFIRK